MTMQGWCIHCQNTGWLDCYCEGDMCGCENGGEYPCPHCDKNDQDELDGMTIDEIADRCNNQKLAHCVKIDGICPSNINGLGDISKTHIGEYAMEQKPQPYYDFEIAKMCKWLKENGYIARVSLSGNLRLEKKPALTIRADKG